MNKLFNATFATSVLVAGALIVQPVSASTDFIKFTDVKEAHDYYTDVYTLVEREVISGYADQTYRPNTELTRGQAAKILAMALKLETFPVTKSSFTDVSVKNQYLPYIEALAQEGIINGYDDGTFKPQNPLTRAQMAKVLVKGFNLVSEDGSLPFTDITTKSGYYGDIQTLYTSGITKGSTPTTFSPNDTVKRGQMASFVMRSERATMIEAEEVAQVQVERLTDSILKIDGNKVVFAKDSYDIPENLQGLLSEKNNVALENATIEMTVKGNQLLTIASLTITAQGTSNAPVILDGALTAGPVASLTPMAITNVAKFDGLLKIESNYIEIRNLKVDKELIISKSVKELILNEPVKALTILEDAEVVIKGKTSIGKVTIVSEKAVQLDMEGTIGELHFTKEQAVVRLGVNLLVSNIQTVKGIPVDKLISNLSAVQMNIEKVNKQKVDNQLVGSVETVTPSETPNVIETPTTKKNVINGEVVQKAIGQKASQASKTIVSYKFSAEKAPIMSNFEFNIDDGDGFITNYNYYSATQSIEGNVPKQRTGIDVAEAIVRDFHVTLKGRFAPLLQKWDVTSAGSEVIFTSKLNKAYDNFQIAIPSNGNRAEIKGEFIKKQQGSQGVDGKIEVNILTVNASVYKPSEIFVTFNDGTVTFDKKIAVTSNDTSISIASKIAAAFNDLVDWDVTNAKGSADVVFTAKEAMDDREVTITIK
ncbi:S-layer homology domain-containing protein [Sporosarcina oncorhynchi]|uniref:S-layer homology domain-containing protein n=1 Tax=Sporosarcina oncorhynchi TaxID=3056444 RepID=A0ABZ0L8U4_9BACL|nr:S-layer homology domain-containing protein [Sporosarcina sp. T2O-4]WOV88062.1 S-layer homology domain-containing protein [Sporosarcina sp. T2O-4]